VVIATPDGPRVAFARGSQPALFAPIRLDAVQTVHAMTVHRAQGSQFGCVSVLLPPPDSPLLTRELLYTAVTRATERVQVFGSEEAIRRAVLRPANRASGLRPRLG
jgi:exodeoxyribonuclease V alpha subunit